jgi:hypothetical protein
LLLLFTFSSDWQSCRGQTASDKQQQRGEQANTKPTVIITGTIEDADGRPISGATVSRSSTPRMKEPFNPALEYPQPTIATVCDATGQFSFEKPAEHMYVSLIAWKSGYAPKAVPFDDRTLTLQLDRGITRKGRIVDSSGAAIAGAVVRLEAWMDARSAKKTLNPGMYPQVIGRIDGDLIKIQTETDAAGSFQLEHLPQNMVVTLIASHPQFYPRRIYLDTSDHLQPIKAKVEIHLNDATIQLDSAPELYIEITTDSGEIQDKDLVARVTQEGLDKYGVKRFEVPVKNGRVDLQGLMPIVAPYLIVVEPTLKSGYYYQQIPVEIGQATSGKIGEIKLSKGVLVRCRCLDETNGRPVAGMKISYEPTSSSDKAIYGLSTLFAETDDQGQASLIVPPIAGTLTAQNAPANQIVGFVTMTPSRSAEVSPQTRERFVKSIAPTDADKPIHVEFLFQSTSPIELVCRDTDGKPVGGVHCVASIPRYRMSAFREDGITDDEGKFTFYNLFCDADVHLEQTVDRSRSGETTILVCTADGARSAMLKIPRLKTEITDQIEITLEDSASITGRVVESNTLVEIEGVRVDCFTGVSGVPKLLPAVYTDSDGLFELHVLAGTQGRVKFDKDYYQLIADQALSFDNLLSGETLSLGSIELTDFTRLLKEVVAPDISQLESDEALATLKASFEKEMERLDGWAPGNSRSSTDFPEMFLVELFEAFGAEFIALASREPNSDFERTVLLECLMLLPSQELMGVPSGETPAIAELREILVTNHLNHPDVRENIRAVEGGYHQDRYIKIFDNIDDVEIRRGLSMSIGSHMAFDLVNGSLGERTDEEFAAQLRELERILDSTFGEFGEHNREHGAFMWNVLKNNANVENEARRAAADKLINKYFGPPFNLPPRPTPRAVP